MRGRRRFCVWPCCFGLLACALFMGAVSAAQSPSHERTFHVSKAELENALRGIHAYDGGKLPILEGFVSADSLDRYRQPHYQYALDLTALGSNETLLRVIAKVSAWYTDPDASRSGYRTLPSNGRLEDDLFERLEEALPGKAKAAGESDSGKSASERGEQRSSAAPAGVLPDSASASKVDSVFRSPSAAAPLPEHAASADDQNRAADKRLQQLRQTAKNLEEILHNQSKPDNLAVVTESRTAVLSRPVAGARVLLLADSEDEFQVLGVQGDWVHVQVTNLLRGWVRRTQLDLSSVAPHVLAAGNPATASGSTKLQQTREETATFPGDWEPLRGKKVRIIWVQSDQSRNDSGAADKRENLATTLFRKAYRELSHSNDKLEGVVIVFDAADGGMAAATLASLERLSSGQLADAAFWKQCWLDPPEAFKKSP